VTPAVRAAHLSIQAVILAVPLATLFLLAFTSGVSLTLAADLRSEQARRTAAALADPAARAKVSTGTNPALDAALANPRLLVRATDLAAQTRAEAETRRAHLLFPQRRALDAIERAAPADLERAAGDPAAVREIALWAGAPDRSAAGRASSPWGTGAAQAYPVFVVVPLGLVLLAAALRGGFSLLLAGVAVVRADGRPAYRRQCAARAALVWLPVAGLLFAATLLQVHAPQRVYPAAGLWLAAAVLLPVYTVVALRFPARPPHDRLVGTYLVPV